MEFGKVPASILGTIDLRLPPPDPRTDELLGSKGRFPQLRVGVGCPLWGAKEWVGTVYPRGAKPTEYLSHYAGQFTSIELNTTHYRVPDRATVLAWRAQTPEDFRFCPKWPQEISHRWRLDINRDLVREFVSNLLLLEDRLGISFLQLPPTFSPRDLPELERFLRSLPREFPIAVEVRHPGFFESQKLIPAYYELLARLKVHVVITDVAGRRDVLHNSLTTPRCLVRFIGNDAPEYDHKRLDEWVERIDDWIQKGLEQIEFFTHQPSDATMPDLAAYFINRLNEKSGLGLRLWQPMKQGEQLGFF